MTTLSPHPVDHEVYFQPGWRVLPPAPEQFEGTQKKGLKVPKINPSCHLLSLLAILSPNCYAPEFNKSPLAVFDFKNF